MTLNTHPEDRREMVRTISEQLQTPAIYMRTPTYAFQIGAVTVDRDGSVTCEDEALLASLRPMLIERGWLNDENAQPETAQDAEQDETDEAENLEAAEAEEEAASEAQEDALDSDDDETSDEQAANSEAQSESPVEEVIITTPLTDWTVPQMTNLLRTMFSRQYLLNRMMQGETIYIEESVIAALKDDPPTDAADFEARVQCAAEEGRVRGIAIEDGKLSFSTPFCADAPDRWLVFQKLLDAILKNAREATRVFNRMQVTPENEKYHANSWLARLGFGGPEHKELRRTLMHHLNGYAAFKSEADMQAHKQKYAQLRRDMREAAE